MERCWQTDQWKARKTHENRVPKAIIANMNSGKKKAGKVVLGIVVAGLAVAGYLFGPTVAALWKAGFFSDVKKSEYVGTSKDNLRRLYTAMMLYHESEGQFPAAEGWMDAIENRLQTADLKDGEGKKKLHNPLLGEDSYGYAMNSLASGKYVDDLPEGKKTILLFDSSKTSRDASGDPKLDVPNPARQGGNLAILADGTLLVDGKPEVSPAPSAK